MPDINLLQNTTAAKTSERKVQSVLNVSGIAVLIVVVLLYGLTFFATKNVESKVAAVNAEKNLLQQDIQAKPEYAQLVGVQDKLSVLSTLIDSHKNWCKILPEFGNVTLKTAKYSKFTANADGSATITGTVPNFQELSKLIRAYQMEGDKQSFVKEVKLVNVGIGGESERNEVTYTLKVTFNSDILKKFETQCSN